MSQANTEVQRDEFGFTEDEYAKERRAARALATGGEAKEEQEQTKAEEQEPPASEAAAAEASPESSTNPAAQPAAEAPQATQDDPLAVLPEDVRQKVSALLEAEKEQVKKLQKKYDSDVGRISAYQSKYEDTRRKLVDLESKLAAANKAPPKSLKESAPNSARLREYAEADPALLEMLDEALALKERELEERFNQRIASVAEPLYEARHVEQQRKFNETLDSKYSNWRETVYAVTENGIATDDKGRPMFSPAWAQYINDQPPSVQQAIVNVNSAEEALWALEHYVEWGTRKGLFASAADNDPQSQMTPTTPAIANADAIAKKRQEDLRKSSPGRQSQVPLATFQNDDLNNPDIENRLRQEIREALKKGGPAQLNWR